MRTLAKGMDGVNDDGFSQEKRLLAWEHPMTSIQVEHGREKGARRGGGQMYGDGGRKRATLPILK